MDGTVTLDSEESDGDEAAPSSEGGDDVDDGEEVRRMQFSTDSVTRRT